MLIAVNVLIKSIIALLVFSLLFCKEINVKVTVIMAMFCKDKFVNCNVINFTITSLMFVNVLFI